jgi:hypothetical protein
MEIEYSVQSFQGEQETYSHQGAHSKQKDIPSFKPVFSTRTISISELRWKFFTAGRWQQWSILGGHREI